MVAYSFQRRFGGPIKRGLEPRQWVPGMKRQTIRSHRLGRSRHAYKGDEIQLYFGMRTRGVELIGRVRCVETQGISIHFRRRRNSDWLQCARFGKVDRPDALNHFALLDGFQDWAELRTFWADQHPGVRDFAGVIIFWVPLSTDQADPTDD